MPMELYSSEAFVRDLVNAISKAEGKPMNIGGDRHAAIDRGYAFQLITEAKRAIEGNFVAAGSVPAAKPASKAPASRSDAIKKLMTKLDKQEAAAKRPRARTAKAAAAVP